MVKVCNTGKLYCFSFTWFPLVIRVGGNVNRQLISCQNCENRMFIDRIVPEKYQVAIGADLGELPFNDRKCNFRFTCLKLNFNG